VDTERIGGSPYLFLVTISLLLTVVCLLVGFYLDIERVKAMGVIYAVLTMPGLIIALIKPSDGDHLTAYVVSLLGLIITAIFSSPFTRTFSIMGLLTITEWPTELVTQQPLTIGLGALAVTLSISPQVLVTALLQIPTGVGEEGFFRPFLIKILAPHMGDTRALVASAVSFGFVHYLAYQMQLYLIVTASISGFILAYVYFRTGSALGVTLAHTTFNIIVILGSLILLGGV